MRLIFLNRFYWPDEPATAQLLTDLAEALAARGHEVTVIASHPPAAGVPRSEVRNGVRVLRTRGTRWAKRTAAGKALDFASFWAAAVWRLSRTVRPGDCVIAMTDPPLIGVGAWLVARVRKARIVHWVQDIYPELASELTHHKWLRLLRPLRDLSWRRAGHCVTLGADMAATVHAAGVSPVRFSIVPNWAPVAAAPPSATVRDPLRTAWGLDGKFVVAYSGNLGRVHDLEPVIALAAALQAAHEIAFLFIGEGAQRKALEFEVARSNLRNVQFRPSQPRAQLASSLGLADVHLVTLRPGCERLVFPSKFYGVVAIGRPVVFIGPRDCELARIVVDHDLGCVAERDDLTSLARWLRHLAADPEQRARFSAAVRRFAAAQGGVQSAAQRWGALLPAL